MIRALILFTLLLLQRADAAKKPSTDGPTSADQFHLTAKKTFFTTFDLDHAGQSPKGWRFEMAGAQAPPPPWPVVSIFQPYSKPHVLQSPAGGVPDELHVALLEDRVPFNGELTVHLKPSRATTRFVTSIIWRWQSPESFYELQLDAREDEARLYRWQKGKPKLIDKKGVIFIPDRWHDVRVIFLYQTYNVFVDDNLCLAGQDKKLLLPGRVGIGAAGDAQFYADDVLLKE